MSDRPDWTDGQIGRVAMRESEDGEWWHGYYAPPDTMERALLIGSIRMAVVRDPVRKEVFMSLIRDTVADIIEAEVGTRPRFASTQPGPPHENRAERRRREKAERRRDRNMN